MVKSKLEKNDALDIATKLGAVVQKNGKHQRAIVRYEGKIIFTFGIRHGTRTGQGHLVGRNRDLRLSETQALALARCTITKEAYFDILRERGLLPE